MNRIWAIAVIALRNAIRSKVVAVMLFLLALVVIALPLTIKHDGTIYGHAQILLQYTLGIITFILAITTMWAGCAAVSLEIQDKQMQMVTTKPITALQIWLGKWLGLMLMNAFLLLFCGVIIYGLMAWTLRPAALSEAEQKTLREEIMISRVVQLPFEDPRMIPAAHAMARERIQMGELPANTTSNGLFTVALGELKRRENSISVGDTRTWVFPLDDAVPRDASTLLRFQFSYSQIGSHNIRGKIRVTTDKAQELYSGISSNAPRHMNALLLERPIPAQAENLIVEYTNDNPAPITLIFSGKKGMQMLVKRGGFLGNFSRAMFLIFIQLAFIGAIGLTMGTLFSMPVAALASCYVMVLVASADYVKRTVGSKSILNFPGEDPPVWLESIVQVLFSFFNVILTPLKQLNYTELLAWGVEIPFTFISGAVLFKLILYSGSMALFGSWVFSKREIALPT